MREPWDPYATGSTIGPSAGSTTGLAIGPFSNIVSRYKASTFLRAHGVRRRNFKLESILGLFPKQLTRTCRASRSHP